MTQHIRAWKTVAAVGLITLVVAGCGARGGDDGARALTSEEAGRLAVVRLENYRNRSGVFSTSLLVDGELIELSGVVDWQDHVGSAVLRSGGSDQPGAEALVQWSFSHIAAHAGGAVDGPPSLPPADNAWQVRPIDPTVSRLDTLLLLLLNLANDRAENPQLLQQNGARWLGDADVDGQPVDIFELPRDVANANASSAGTVDSAGTGPNDRSGRPQFWIDRDGNLVRFAARLGGAPDYVEVDFVVGDHPPVQAIPRLVDDATTKQR